MTNRNDFLIAINSETAPILQSASSDMLSAIELLLEGYEPLEIAAVANDALDRDDRRNLLICRKHLILDQFDF